MIQVTGPSTSTGCGKGSCPNCHTPYVNRYKPRVCSKCKFDIGGSYVPKLKTIGKVSIPNSTIVFTDESTKNIFHYDNSKKQRMLCCS